MPKLIVSSLHFFRTLRAKGPISLKSQSRHKMIWNSNYVSEYGLCHWVCPLCVDRFMRLEGPESLNRLLDRFLVVLMNPHCSLRSLPSLSVGGVCSRQLRVWSGESAFNWPIWKGMLSWDCVLLSLSCLILWSTAASACVEEAVRNLLLTFFDW